MTCENACVDAIKCCANCCLRVFAKVSDYISEDGFQYMAVSGDHFTDATWSAFLLELNYFKKFRMGLTLTSLIIFFSKAVMTFINSYLWVYWMKTRFMWESRFGIY
jgi:hypothetical protein